MRWTQEIIHTMLNHVHADVCQKKNGNRNGVDQGVNGVLSKWRDTHTHTHTHTYAYWRRVMRVVGIHAYAHTNIGRVGSQDIGRE